MNQKVFVALLCLVKLISQVFSLVECEIYMSSDKIYAPQGLHVGYGCTFSHAGRVLNSLKCEDNTCVDSTCVKQKSTQFNFTYDIAFDSKCNESRPFTQRGCCKANVKHCQCSVEWVTGKSAYRNLGSACLCDDEEMSVKVLLDQTCVSPNVYSNKTKEAPYICKSHYKCWCTIETSTEITTMRPLEGFQKLSSRPKTYNKINSSLSHCIDKALSICKLRIGFLDSSHRVLSEERKFNADKLSHKVFTKGGDHVNKTTISHKSFARCLRTHRYILFLFVNDGSRSVLIYNYDLKYRREESSGACSSLISLQLGRLPIFYDYSVVRLVTNESQLMYNRDIQCYTYFEAYVMGDESQLYLHLTVAPPFLPWYFASCREGKCTFENCNVNSSFTKKEEQCKLTNVLKLGIYINNSKVSPMEERELPHFMNCFLKHELELDVTGQWWPVEKQLYVEGIDTRIYWFSFLIYNIGHPDIPHTDNVINEIISKLSSVDVTYILRANHRECENETRCNYIDTQGRDLNARNMFFRVSYGCVYVIAEKAKNVPNGDFLNTIPFGKNTPCKNRMYPIPYDINFTFTWSTISKCFEHLQTHSLCSSIARIEGSVQYVIILNEICIILFVFLAD